MVLSTLIQPHDEHVLDELQAFPFAALIPVQFRDLDALGHVNHAVYLSYFETARIGYYRTVTHADASLDVPMILAEMTATYHAPALLGETLAVGARVAKIGTKSFTMEYLALRTADGRRIASGRSVQVMFDYAAQQSVPVSETFRAQVVAFQGEFPEQAR